MSPTSSPFSVFVTWRLHVSTFHTGPCRDFQVLNWDLRRAQRNFPSSAHECENKLWTNNILHSEAQTVKEQEAEHTASLKVDLGKVMVYLSLSHVQTSLQKPTMFSHSSLASPSSLCRSASTSMLSFLFGYRAGRSWVTCCWGVWQARQCLALTLLMRVHAGHDHSSVLLTGTTHAGNDAEASDAGDISSVRMLRRLPGRSSGWARCETASVDGEGLKLCVWLRQTSGGGTSLRLQGRGLLWPEDAAVSTEELVCGYEASTGKHSPRVVMERDNAPAAGSGCCAPVWSQTSGASKASAGIWGRDSLRGPPQAEQDMEIGVFCRVHLKQSQARLFLSASSGCFLFCCLHGSIDDGLRGPEQLLERWGRGWSSDELRGPSSNPV